MQVYRFTEEASLSKVCQALILTVLITGGLTFCLVTLFRDCPILSPYWWFMSLVLFGSLLGKSLEKVVGWTALRGEKIATFLAFTSLGVSGWLFYRLWIVQTGFHWEHLASGVMIVYLCFYNFRWQKYGHCSACDRWLQPVRQLGPYRYQKRVMSLLQAQEVLDLSSFEPAEPKSWKYLELTLSRCPDCAECSTLRVLKVEHHFMGSGRQVLGLVSVPTIQRGPEIGPSLVVE